MCIILELVVKTVPELTDMCLERREGGALDGTDDSLLINDLTSHGQEVGFRILSP